MKMSITCVAAVLAAYMSVAGAEVPKAFQTELGGLISSPEAGVAVGYLQGDEVSVAFVGRPPFSDETLFEYGSLTKVFTSLVLAELVAEGTVALDESINAYLPPQSRAETWDEVTLQDLATHTSGLPPLPPSMDEAYLSREGDNPYANFTQDDLWASLTAVSLTPGHGYRYSNYGFGLLGALLARAAGEPYEDLVTRYVLTPLEMTDTTLTGWSSTDVAPPLLPTGEEATVWDFDALAGAGAARGDLRDALRFLRASRDACSAPTPLAQANCRAQQATDVQIAEFARQGLGWIRSESPSGDIVWHDGGTGGYSSFLGFNTQTGAGVVMLINVAGVTDGLLGAGLNLLAQPAD